MASENELTIYTDFDRTRVKQNTPIQLMSKFFHLFPIRIMTGTISALRSYGLHGRGFLEVLRRIPAIHRGQAADQVVKRLRFNRKWVATLQKQILFNSEFY